MRTQIREDAVERQEETTIRVGDQLLEKWAKKKNLGEGLVDLYGNNPRKARNTAIVLENQERYLKRISEAQVSTDFGTTPINVLRVIRLGYPNSVRGDLFHEFAMVTARDSIYYLKTIYESTARGATAGDVTYESSADRYFSEIQQEAASGTVNGVNGTFTGPSAGALSIGNVRPFYVRVLIDGKPVASDNGAGAMTGPNVSSGSINYTSGAFTVTFTGADIPATGSVVTLEYLADTENPANYGQIKAAKLQLTDYNFRARPWPLYVSWSKMTELLLGTTLDIEAEENLMRGAGDELKKSLDYQAVRYAYGYSKQNPVTTFNADFSSAGADSAKDHAQSLTRALAQAEKTIYNQLQRGGINNLVIGTDVAAYLTLHDRFTEEGLMPKIGIYRIGTLQGIPVYQAPNDVVPANEMMGIWRNETELQDVAVAFGTLVPLYQTQTLEFRQAYKETGLFHFGDQKALNPKYLTRIQLTGLDVV